MSNSVFANCGIGFDFDFFFGQDLPDQPDWDENIGRQNQTVNISPFCPLRPSLTLSILLILSNAFFGLLAS
jgi:hypothetical protein